MTPQETAARDLEAAATELETFIRECPDATWTKASPNDGRSVASIAYHCAAGNDVALGWICQILAGRPVLETADSHNAHNAAEAQLSAGFTKEQVCAALARTTERAAQFVRSMTDEELERHALFGISGRELLIGRFVPNYGRHIRDHLEEMKQALATHQT
jgi:DinB family protein